MAQTETEQKIVRRADFPVNYVWGAATASYQIEGATQEDGRTPSIWDMFSHTLGKTTGGDTGDVACDHYHRRDEDIALMKQIGLNGYRFSISWSRVLPDAQGQINQKGLDFYDQLVDRLLENGIEPAATLYHWDLPLYLHEKGGWKNRATAHAFVEYADKISQRLGDRVKNWITFNEPWVSSALGYLLGEHAPGEQDWNSAVRAGHHLLLAHGLAVPVLRRNVTRADAEVGITLSINYFAPGDASPEALKATQLADAFAHRWFLDPLFKGSYPDLLDESFGPHLPIEAGDMAVIAAPIDFLGVNYYSRSLVLEVEDLPTWKLKIRRPTDSQYTEMDWEVNSEGLYHLLTRLKNDYQPAKMYITENGAAFDDKVVTTSGGEARVHDPERMSYLQNHFAAAQQAIAEGVPLAGHYVWSLLDNFEWAHGYSKRFGITYVDYATQQRILKDSGRWYQEFLKK